MAKGLLGLGVERLPWTKPLKQWRDRVMFLRRAEPETPGLISRTRRSEASPDWLAPYLLGKTSLAEIGADDLAAALKAPLDYALSATARPRGADAFPRADRKRRADRL